VSRERIETIGRTAYARKGVTVRNLGTRRVRDAGAWRRARSLTHREDLHRRQYQYADQCLSKDEARRIAQAISRLTDLLKRPPC
jgi:hypothetical protein